MKYSLFNIAGEVEIKHLLDNDLIAPEHVNAEADESYFVEDYTNKGSGSTCLRYTSMVGFDELVVWVHSNAEPQAWIPGENGMPSFEEMKLNDLGEDE